MKRHSETQIIKTTVMKGNEGLNGDLKPERKKITTRTSRARTSWARPQARIIRRQFYFLVETAVKKYLKYSRLSLSRLRLSRITAYLEVTIWSQFLHENLITGNKILWKLRSDFSSLPQYFQYISNFRSQITYSFVKCGC